MRLRDASLAVFVVLVAGTAAFAQAPKVKPAITALAIAPDGQSIVYGSQAGVVVRSLKDDTEQSLPTQLDHVCALAFSPDRTHLAIAGGSPGESGAVEVYSWPARKRIARLEGHDDVVHGIVWLPESKQIFSASADRTVRFWNVAAGKCLETLGGHSGPVLALAVSPDGKWLCSGSGDQTIRVWSVAERKLVRSLNNHLGAVHALAFRPQSEGLPFLASASEDGTVRIWQPSIGRMVRIVRHPAPVVCLAWSKDASRIYTGSRDGCVRQVDGDSDAILHARKLDAGRIASLALRDDDLRIGHVSGTISRVAPSEK
ncbi:MAG: WD40 repeat domain-containing protein [Gemmataceae bacterium]|nr:WD40 repeat domain-containing protein [Gemmataceae bacterium]